MSAPTHAVSMALVEQEMRQVRQDMAELKNSVDKLMEIHSALRVVIAVIKWTAGIAAAAAAMWASWRQH